MKKFLAWYTSLPKELRAILAMIGLATPIGAIYLLQKILRDSLGWRIGTMELMIGIALVIGAICLLSWLIAKLFKRGRARRSRKLAADLAGDADRGPVSMDVRAAIKANNDKFFTAIGDMRKRLKVNVYDLPWYIIIGDSGCGKTKLVNESGLTFSTGKPEGYQLGTLNYNWWFTEDAIFIDMAGRLCNPQEDADYKEWQAFLSTVGKGRKGYPINGALVCVSAEHLLADPPEKHEQGANTALERLRDLQSKLGVTFATYLVVTKCDKILGFMPFFDRAHEDPRIKHQIFGWSKPGDFNELYDPEQFEMDFNSIYTRLVELRLRRMYDDADELELGTAYSFPEEFRELRMPLHIYVRTLFPMIKNPKAIKNLILRGVYFTSATQQGSVILKHLAERLGEDAARNFAPLESLYPRPRPHFVRELLYRKVFPEYGLVFRNEQEALRNQKAARLLKYGSGVLAALTITLFSVGLYKFNRLIAAPKQKLAWAEEQDSSSGSDKVVFKKPPARASFELSQSAALGMCLDLGKDRRNLEDNLLWAKVLSIWGDYKSPPSSIRTVETDLFEEAVLAHQLKEVGSRLREVALLRPDDEPPSDYSAVEPKVFRDCLGEYLRLCRYKDAPAPDKLDVKDLEKLFLINRRVHPDTKKNYLGDVALGVAWDDFLAALDVYVRDSNDRSGRSTLHVGRLLNQPGQEAVATVTEAIDKYREYLRPSADFKLAARPASSAGTEPAQYRDEVAHWLAIGYRCQAVGHDHDEATGQWQDVGVYGAILNLRNEPVAGSDQLRALNARFAGALAALRDTLAGCAWDGTTEKAKRLRTLAELAGERRAEWYKEYEFLWRKYAVTSPPETGLFKPTGVSSPEIDPAAAAAALESDIEPDADITAAIRGFLVRPPDRKDWDLGLDDTLHDTLKHAGLLKPDREDGDSIEKSVVEVFDRFPHVIRAERRKPDDPREPVTAVTLTDDARTVLEVLTNLAGEDPGAGRAADAYKTLEDCTKGLQAARERLANVRKPESVAKIGVGPEWRGDELAEFVRTRGELVARGAVADALSATLDLLRSADPAVSAPQWGLAELRDGYADSVASNYRIRVPDVARRAEPAPTPRRPTRTAEPQPSGRSRDRSRTRTRADAARPAARDAGGVERTVPRCATTDFLWEVFLDAADLTDLELNAVAADDYLTDGDDLPAECRDALKTVKQAYLSKYFREWRTAYGRWESADIDEMLKAPTWEAGRDLLRNRYTAVQSELQLRCAELLHNVAWADLGWDKSGWEEDHTLLKDAKAAAWNEPGKNWADGFLGRTRGRSIPGDEPWLVVADRLAAGWKKFAETVIEYRPLPAEFSAGVRVEPIEWRALPSDLASDLADLEYARRIEEVVTRFRDLMDAEVQTRIVGIQAKHNFKETDARLPYAKADALQTVDARNFAAFAKAVTVAAAALDPLDRGLPGFTTRKPFYDLCEQWRKFLYGTKDDPCQDAVQVELTVDAVYDQSGSHPGYRWWNADTRDWWTSAAPVTNNLNLYPTFEPRLGLRQAEDAAVALAIPAAPSADQNLWKLEWAWPARGVEEASITLLEGSFYKPTTPAVTLAKIGTIDELFLPAFLENMATRGRDGTEWKLAVRWDVEKLLAAQNPDAVAVLNGMNIEGNLKMLGTKLVITLSRALPKPIACLKAPSR